MLADEAEPEPEAESTTPILGPTSPGINVNGKSKKSVWLKGCLQGHPAFYPETGLMRGEWGTRLQEELIKEYCKEEFQIRLCGGWHATKNYVEKHQWRQKVCLEIQAGVFPRYGYEPTRRGVWASGMCCSHEDFNNEEHARNYFHMEWLVNPDNAESKNPEQMTGFWTNFCYNPSLKEGGDSSSNYKIIRTDQEDGEALFGIAHCQGALAGAHLAMHQKDFPSIELDQWQVFLGCGNMHDAIDSGLLVFHALSVETGRVAGFISCKLHYGTSDEPPHAKVHNVVILERHRGHGVGRQLFFELTDHLSVTAPSLLSDMRISVAAQNARAKEWYQRLGFTQVEEFFAFRPRTPVKFIGMQRKLDADDFDDMFQS